VMGTFREQFAELNAAFYGSAHGQCDESLVKAAKSGHSLAFDALTERYRKQLFRTALRITRSCEDAEDAVQDALLSAFLHVREFDGRSSFGTWLTRIAINSALMHLRKKRSSGEIVTDYNDDVAADGVRLGMTERRPNPEKQYAQSEEESMLKKAIEGLRPALRAVVQIQVLQESSMRETAEAIGISMSATKGRLFHAKKALRRAVVRKLKEQYRFNGRIRVLTERQWLGQNAGTNTPRRPRQDNHKEKGNEYVVKTEDTNKYGAPNNSRPCEDGRSLCREAGA
jgi:RNA polymerase sigma factor (sigma-70 family)